MIQMNETARFRAKLHTLKGTFTALYFASEIPGINSILQKMNARGEVILVGSQLIGVKRTQRIFKVGKIYQPAEEYIKVKSVGRTHIPKAMLPWRDIYPELFAVPDFSGYQHTVRRNLMEV